MPAAKAMLPMLRVRVRIVFSLGISLHEGSKQVDAMQVYASLDRVLEMRAKDLVTVTVDVVETLERGAAEFG